MTNLATEEKVETDAHLVKTKKSSQLPVILESNLVNLKAEMVNWDLFKRKTQYVGN